MKLQKLTIDSLEQVTAIEQQAHHYPWSKAALTSAFAHNDFLGIYQQTQLCGFAILLNTVDTVELLNIAVLPLYQGQGYGYQLLQAAVIFTQQKNIARVLLEVRVSNEQAIRLYQRYGFIEIHRRKGYYLSQHGREDALIMAYQI